MKRLNCLAIFSTLAFAVAVPSFGACTDADMGDDIELAEPTDELDVEKADEATLPASKLIVAAPINSTTERVGLIKTKTHWRQVFGTEAPASVDFSRQWVAFYTAGAQNTAGFSASVTKIQVTPSGETLTIVTNLERPNFDCEVAQTIKVTLPYAVIAFKKPTVTPITVRYSKRSLLYFC
ncbi:MAG: protease complex subunit PrcB family protein [Kofleriaceae bacterium]|nr:protease complex subunit PrcB family protein [Kofleriaceae bacterium]